MKLSEIIDKSVYCSIGCITSSTDIQKLEQYLLYNSEVISLFSKIIVAHTKLDSISYENFDEYNAVWEKIFPNKCVILKCDNHGHTFGFTYLDSIVISKAKELGCEYIWKSTNDVLVLKEILSINVDDIDFLYLQGDGYVGLDSYYNFDIDKAVRTFSDDHYEHFFPQTNFFIIKSKIDCLIDKEKFESLYQKCITDEGYLKNKIQTEYKYLLCECVLRDCVWRNNLKCKHLIGKESYKKLLEIIVLYKIADSSHKNILFTECGICHYHYVDHEVIII